MLQRNAVSDSDQTRVDRWARAMMEGGYQPRWAPQSTAQFSPQSVRPSEIGTGRGISSFSPNAIQNTAFVDSYQPQPGAWQQQSGAWQQTSTWVPPSNMPQTSSAKPKRGLWSKVKSAFRSGSAAEQVHGCFPDDESSMHGLCMGFYSMND